MRTKRKARVNKMVRRWVTNVCDFYGIIEPEVVFHLVEATRLETKVEGGKLLPPVKLHVQVNPLTNTKDLQVAILAECWNLRQAIVEASNCRLLNPNSHLIEPPGHYPDYPKAIATANITYVMTRYLNDTEGLVYAIESWNRDPLALLRYNFITTGEPL